MIFVISAPSGAGKTSVLHRVLEYHPELVFSVSVTTRQPRGNERDGIDYHFVDDKLFDEYIRKEEFVEWAVVHGCRYGTLKSEVQAALDRGRSVIMDTDTVGAFAIKKHYPEAVLIFITTPSPEILDDRLRKRDTESPERLEKRLSAAPKEIAKMKDYNYIVVNDILDSAVSRLHCIIEAEKLRSGRVVLTLAEWRKYLG
ncbi:guanylate kinase [bacterium]|nr:guanylate kinase [bacterium]